MAETDEAAEQRNWAELPTDALSVIYRKLGVVGILQSAGAVCRPWRHLALDPHFYRRIRITGNIEDSILMEKLACKAIDRSDGHVEAFFAEYCGSDDLLSYIAHRARGLKRLTLIFPGRITTKGMNELVRRCPLLEKCAVLGSIREVEPQLPGRRVCRRMEFFGLAKLHHTPNDCWESGIDLQALETEDSIPQLLEPRESSCDQAIIEGLRAILEKYLRVHDLVVEKYVMKQFTINVDVDASLRANLVKCETKSFFCPMDADDECWHPCSRILRCLTWDVKKLLG